MTRDYTVFTEVKASKQEILNCSYSKWYNLFKDHAYPCVIIKPLPQTFLDYLASESIQLQGNVDVDVNSNNSYSDWEDNDGVDVNIDPTEKFQHLHQQIIDVFTKYKAVTPKLNWSAPKDASWIIVNNSMKCQTVNDIYLLLNASDHITHDLDHPFEDVYDESNDPDREVEYELVLRKWREINPALEFRVFIRNGIIVGKSQRDINHYDYLGDLINEHHLNTKINTFVNQIVIPKFPNKSFIIDLYIPRPFNSIYIIDINAFIRVSDSILYTWNELLTDKEDSIRLITETNIGRFKTKQYSENQVPLDIIQASCDPNSLVELAKEWQIKENF